MKNNNSKLFLITTIIIVLASSYRLTDHPSNFVPITAICLLAGSYLGRNIWSFIIPIAALFVGDFILNNMFYRDMFHGEGLVWFADYMIFGYLTFGLIVFGAIKFLKKRSGIKIILSALGASVLFFLVTNFGSWLSLPQYTKDVAGLISAYEMGIPFFRATVFGDLLFTVVLFGAVELYSRLVFQRQLTTA